MLSVMKTHLRLKRFPTPGIYLGPLDKQVSALLTENLSFLGSKGNKSLDDKYVSFICGQRVSNSHKN